MATENATVLTFRLEPNSMEVGQRNPTKNEWVTVYMIWSQTHLLQSFLRFQKGF